MEYKIINIEYLNEISTDITFIKKMLSLFKKNISEYEKEMNVFLKNKEYKKLGELAHKAKSSVIIFGMKQEADDMKALELDTKTNKKIHTYKQRVDDFISTCKKALLEVDILEKEL